VVTRPQADELGQHSQQHSRTVHEYLGDLASIEDRSWRNGRFPVLIFEGSDPSMSEPAIMHQFQSDLRTNLVKVRAIPPFPQKTREG
jgi:hypothetical protein